MLVSIRGREEGHGIKMGKSNYNTLEPALQATNVKTRDETHKDTNQLMDPNKIFIKHYPS